jgi:hypothetical protein
MLSNSWRPLVLVFGHLLLCCSLVAAQPAGGTPAPQAAKPQAATPAEKPRIEEVPATRVEESKPSVYYLPDKDGHLQPVLDFKYQDFEELYKLKNQLGRRDEPPRYSVERMTVAGTAAEEYAELSLQFQVLVRDDGWVRVPLRLDQGLLRGVATSKGRGEQFVHYEGEGEGYVWWVRGKPDTQHATTLTMLVPLATVGDETRLKLFAPRATVSELKLTVPLADAVGKVSEGATLLPAVAVKKGGTEFDVAGLGGDFQLAWHKSTPRPVERSLVLEAASTVLTRLDRRAATAEATLSVRSYGAAFDRFTVRLPPGASLSPAGANGYVVTPVQADAKQKEKSSSVEVRFAKATTGPVEVHLACRRDYDPLKDSSWCELAGFEVVGAAQQWGVTAVTTGDDWQVLWGTSSGVRQTDQLPESLRKPDLVAGYEYSAQPYSLTARLAPRKTRVSVDPKYVLLVDRDTVRLEGKLTYMVRGAKIATLDLAMPGWELDEVGPDNLVVSDAVTLHGGEIDIPLVQPSSGTMELQFRAHRAIEAGAKSLSVVLPQPRAGTSGPASLAVQAADNVELIPNKLAIEGLVQQRIAPATKLPERQQDPLFYRGTVGPATFAADFRLHVQRITVDVTSRVMLSQHTAEVEQRQSYSISYEPVDHLTIAAPRGLAAAKRIQILCDGKPLVSATPAEELTGEDAMAPVSMRVTLPGPRVGACELVLQYSVPVGATATQPGAMLALPLPMPKDGQLVSNNLSLKVARNLRVTPRKQSAWTVVEREEEAAGRSDLRLAAAKAVGRLDLDLRHEADDTQAATVIDRAWVQSWLTSVARQDRAAYQLTTNRKELEVVMPAGALASQVVVLVDGQRVEGRATSDDRLLVPLVGQRDQHRFVIELQYHFPEARPPRGALRLEFPRVGPNTWVRRMYWQIILPANEHVTANPAGFTGEFTWDWEGYFWGRQPLLDQGQLESWVGATARPPLPERDNLYLFSTLGDVPQAEIHTVGRTWIVLWASSVVLVIGLLLIYVPASRHPAALLVVGLGLLAAGLIAPEPTFLLAQAASLGLGLALLTGLLSRGMSGRGRRVIPRKESSHSRIEVGSTRTPQRPLPANGPAPTESIPAVQPSPTGNASR